MTGGLNNSFAPVEQLGLVVINMGTVDRWFSTLGLGFVVKTDGACLSYRAWPRS